MTLAAVVELMHLATLVHDDSVDHSALRRGLPTVNSLFSHQVERDHGRLPVFARARSARRARRSRPAARADGRVERSSPSARCGSSPPWNGSPSPKRSTSQLIEAKTASLLSAACETGAICGAARHRAALKRFGERLGMAFQVADDILDYTETASVTGKPAGLDLREHKVTLPLIAALPKLSPAGRAKGRRAVRVRGAQRRAGRRGRRSRDRGRRNRRGAAPRRAVRTRGRRGAAWAS